jgi:Uma2 family endonuclease
MVAERVKGALHTQPRPASRHVRATFRLAVKLGNPYEDGVGGPGGWVFAIEPELHIARDVLVPDVAGWRQERMGEYPDTPAIEVVPDWVCEILSPSTRRFDLGDKRAAYGAHGVGHLWLLDPQARLLEAFVLRDGAWSLAGTAQEGEEVRLVPFDATAFPLASLWP